MKKMLWNLLRRLRGSYAAVRRRSGVPDRRQTAVLLHMVQKESGITTAEEKKSQRVEKEIRQLLPDFCI